MTEDYPLPVGVHTQEWTEDGPEGRYYGYGLYINGMVVGEFLVMFDGQKMPPVLEEVEDAVHLKGLTQHDIDQIIAHLQMREWVVVG